MAIRKTLFRALLVAAATVGLSAGNTASAETLQLVTNWGKNVYSVKRTLEWADAFNKSAAAKAADIRIRHIGGPEVTPAVQQLTAVRNGVVDMLFGAAGYYVGQVPEGFVFYGTEITPMKARANGGTALLNRIYEKKANAHVLGWVAAGVGYHVWLKAKPKFKPDGTPAIQATADQLEITFQAEGQKRLPRRLHARGNVVLRGRGKKGDMRIRANELIYDWGSARLILKGKVRVEGEAYENIGTFEWAEVILTEDGVKIQRLSKFQLHDK